MDQMKTKRLALLFACILCTTTVYLLYGDLSVQPSIQNFVTETHSRFANWKSVQVKQEPESPEPEEIYLKKLGFVQDPRLYPKNKWNNVTLPVFVSSVTPSEINYVVGFVKSFMHHFPNFLLILYDVGLNPSDQLVMNGLCNTSSCCARSFDFNAFPSHVRDLQHFAYRPIIIQEVLNQVGAVVVLDVQYIFNSGEIRNLVNQAEKYGLISWTINEPTSALTHPRMFDYFDTKQEKYYFHRMVQPSHIILYNTNAIHFGVMLPWVKCSLVSNCIAPIGAQNSGCRFDKKPLYRYSGCHRYDTSALNVVLGLMFDFSSSHYAAKEEEKFFHLVDIETKVIQDPEGNSTFFPQFV